jgi:hypothetical protein
MSVPIALHLQGGFGLPAALFETATVVHPGERLVDHLIITNSKGMVLSRSCCFLFDGRDGGCRHAHVWSEQRHRLVVWRDATPKYPVNGWLAGLLLPSMKTEELASVAVAHVRERA